MRRQRRRLEEIAPVTFNTVTGADGIAAALQDFLVLEASGWKGVAGTAIVDEPAIKTFVQTAVVVACGGRPCADRPDAARRQPIAATVTLQSGDTAWCWKIAYNEGMARFSPGVQLICELTEKLAAEQRSPGPTPAPPPIIR